MSKFPFSALALALATFACGVFAGRPIVRIDLNYRRLYPEGITADLENDQLLIGSMAEGVVFGIPIPSGEENGERPSSFVVRVNDSDVSGFIGIHYNSRRTTLHACVFHGTFTNTSYATYALGYDNGSAIPATWRRLAMQPMGSVQGMSREDAAHSLNDLVIGPQSDGNETIVYATDTVGNMVISFEGPHGRGTILSRDPLFSSSGPLHPAVSNMGVNGIVYSPPATPQTRNGKEDERSACGTTPFILTGSALSGELFRVDPKTGDTRRVRLDYQGAYAVPMDGLSLVHCTDLVVTTSLPRSAMDFWKTKDGWESATLVERVELFNSGTQVDPGVTTNVVLGDMVYALGARVSEFTKNPNGNASTFYIFKVPLQVSSEGDSNFDTHGYELKR